MFSVLLSTAVVLLLSPMQFVDADRDSIRDELEQQLLEKFRPKFFVGQKDCNGLPSEFQPGVVNPRSLSRNGTIYGQVFRPKVASAEGVLVEIHYYHLWSRDCGRFGHDLDTEHVSALVHAASLDSPVEQWTARYWYAAAHEDTACNASNAAPADALNATEQGPSVWISNGKHASYLIEEFCRNGCGSDRCGGMVEMRPSPLVNIGERAFPMNGAMWTASTKWPLALKMTTDFTPSVMGRLDAQTASVRGVDGSIPPAKAIILSGNVSLDGLATSGRHTGTALAVGEEKTTNAAGKAISRTGKSVWKALGVAGRGVKIVVPQ